MASTRVFTIAQLTHFRDSKLIRTLGMANTMQDDPHLELLGFTNSLPKHVVTPPPTTSERSPDGRRVSQRTMELANKALERSQAAHRKSVQSMEKPQMSKAPRQISGEA
jgi:hypothetical protein